MRGVVVRRGGGYQFEWIALHLGSFSVFVMFWARLRPRLCARDSIDGVFMYGVCILLLYCFGVGLK